MLDPTSKIFGRAWKIYKKDFWKFVAIVVPPVVLIVIGVELLIYLKAAAFFGILFVLAGAVLFVLAATGLILALAKRAEGVGEAYRRAMPFFWKALWLGILTELTVIGGVFMLVIPGILLGTWFAFASFALVLEGHRGMHAMSRSRDYVRGYWWPVFGRMFLLSIVVDIIAVILRTVIIAIIGPVAGEIVYYAFWSVALPLELAYLYEIYENVRRVKPAVAESRGESKSNRPFFVTSAIIGLVAPIILLILVGTVWAPAIENAQLQMMQQNQQMLQGYGGGNPS
jgi:hypothetical protein